MSNLHPAPVLGVIGGSGLYDIEGLENVEWREVGSPFDSLCGNDPQPQGQWTRGGRQYATPGTRS